MSQNDFDIEDGTGEAVLNDINSALQALASNSKEQNAPSTSYPSQFFANESSGKLSYRDGSDPSTYYNLANLDGGLFVDQASTFNGDVIFQGTNGIGNITFDPSVTNGAGGFKFSDFATIRLGTDDDFVISHSVGFNIFASITDKPTTMITKTTGGTQACYTLQTEDSSDRDNAYQAFVNGHQELHFNGTEKFRTSASGITVTGSVTTQDINMSNLNSLPNEVDNTQGSWSIQEGSDDLFLINRINGKKYKFNLTEVS
tara:strand:- start:75 stop:848 length:774 start_codon:yes stop_codon:yes gene_type:complete